MTRAPLILQAGTCVVRSARAGDARSLAQHADNRKVWSHLRDAFPHPYGLADAKRFVRAAAQHDPETYFVIDLGGDAIGAIGYRLQSDIDRASAEIGYWVGEPFWGRGIATAALVAVTRCAFARHEELHRVFALPFAGNPASSRVLEKAGYRFEARLHHSAIKEGRVIDQLQYAANRDSWRPGDAVLPTD